MKLRNLTLSVSVALSASLISSGVVANPSGAQVINGQVSFTKPDANTLQINNSHGAIINWQDFSINAGELTHFQQSGANSAVLNQVTGGNVSNIFGSLTSNGQVYLINPTGIVFGQNSIVNTAGFIASTLNLSNQDFLQGELNFEGVESGDILNQGFITAGAHGDIALIAPNIVNEGVINVEKGDVILAAGEKVTLASLDASAVGFEVQAEENSVTNLGSVTTDGGAVAMFAGTLQHEGVIAANALSLDEHGNVVLVAKNNLKVTETASISANGEDGGRVVIQNKNGTTWVSGEIEATGENGNGGVVDVLGQQVGVIDNAIINVDGKTGGGEIHIGGNYQGKGELQNATGTYVGVNTSLSANAIESGDGGEVIVWADEATRAYGSISATGGELFGDGGFVETSGKQYLDVNGIDLNIGAVKGENGNWLLDPVDITISSAADSGTVVTPFPDFTSSTASNILITTLETALNNNANVSIATNGGVGGLGDITLDAALLFNLGNTSTLTLNADNDIIFTANATVTVASSSNLTLNLNAINDISINGNMVSDASSLLTLNATADSDTNNIGAITLSSAIATNGGNVNLFAGNGITLTEVADVQTLNGSVTLDTVTNNILLNAATGGARIQTTSGNIFLQAQSGTSNITIQSGAPSAQLLSTSGNIDLVADEITIFGSVGTGSVTTLKPFSNGTLIQLQTTDAVGTGNLVIGSDELANISGDVVIGDLAYNLSPIDIQSSIVFSSGSNLALLTGNNINFNQTAGTAIDAGINSVNLQADKIEDIGNVNLDILAASLDIQTANGAGFTFGDEIDLQVDNLTFNNSATGSVAVSNSGANPFNVSGSNTSNDSGVIIQIDNNSPSINLGNISGGPNGDFSITNFAGDVVINSAAVISVGANAVDHLFSASGSVALGAGSIIHNNSGSSSITIDAANLDVLSGSIDAFNGDVYINPFSTLDIGVGDGTVLTTGLVIEDAELANINAGMLMIGNSGITNVDLGTFIDLGVLGYDLFLAAGNALTFQPGSGIDVSGGRLSLFAPLLDFTGTTITSSASGVIEFVNIADAPTLQLDATCGSVTGAMCVSQTNLDALTGFAKVDLYSELGSIDFTSAITFTSDLGMDTFSGSDAININDTVDVGVNNIFVSSGMGAGTINFNSAATTEIIANNITLDAATITNVASSVPNIVANTIDFTTDNGFGSAAVPFLTSVSQIVSGINTNSTFEIFIDNDTPLYIQSLSQGSAAGLSTTIYNVGDITVGNIDGGGNTVILDTTIVTNGGLGGAILDDTLISPNVSNAFRVELYSETGIGSATDNFEIGNINDGDVVTGGLFVSAEGSGDIFINNVGGAGSAFDIQAVTTGSSGEVFIHNATQVMNLNGSITTTVGDITLESNSAINLIASLNAGGGSNVNVTMLSGGGNIAIDGGLLSGNAINVTNNLGDIVFGSTGYVLAPNVNLSANGIIDDSAATNAIGAGSQVGFLNAVATGNINLTGAANDADILYLQSNAGDVSYTDINDINLDQIIATNSAILTSGGEVLDNNGAAVNITAPVVTVNAVNGIGIVDQIETSISTSLNFSNTVNGSVNFIDFSVNNVDFWGNNNSVTATDFTQFISQNGSITVPGGQALSALNTDIVLDTVNTGSLTIDGTVSVSNVNSEIVLMSPLLTVNGSVLATGTSLLGSVLLKADDMVISGTVDGGVGDLGIENLTDGNTISLGGVSGDLNLSATDLGGITAGRISIGQNGGVGPSLITVEGAIDFGSVDTRLASVGDIVFNQGGANGISSLANIELNTEGAIVDNSTGGFDVSANGLYMVANNGIGSVDAIDTRVAGLQAHNVTAGAINIDNSLASMSLAFIYQDAVSQVVNISNTGDIVFVDNGTDVAGITSVNGDVVLSSSAGAILDSGVTISHIRNANSVTLNGATGVGNIVTAISVEDLGAGGLTASTSGVSGIYIDNEIGVLTSDFIINSITSGSGSVAIYNLNAAQDTRIAGPVSLAGGSFTVISPASMFIDGDITDSLNGAIDLQVTGGGGNLFIDTGNIQSNGGTVSLTADTDIQFTGTGNVSNAATGLTSLFATNGTLQTLTTAGVIGGGDLNASAANGIDLSGNNNVGVLNLSATSGNIVFNDTNNIQLGLISASTLSGVTINSAGAITDNNLALNNVTAQTVTLNAVNGIGTLADPIELSIDNFIQFTNSTSGDVYLVNSVPNNILLNGSNAGGDVNVTLDNNILLQTINAGGVISLTSNNGGIQDSNGAGVINLTAANINIAAFGNIGGGDPINTPAPIETQTTGATGSINVSNSSSAGHIEVLNYAVNTTDVLSVTSNNAGINGETYLLNPDGRTEINNVTSDGFIEIKALELSLNGVVNNNDIVGATSIFLVTDEFDVTTGSVNANAGFIDLITFTDGRNITLGAVDAGGTSLDLVQADISAFNASGIKIGKNDSGLLSGSGDINVTGSLDFGAADLKLETLNNINFNNGTQAGLSTTGIMDVVANLAITSDLSTGFSLISPTLSIAASNGIGSVNPVRTQTGDLSVFNTNTNHVSILNSGALLLSDSASLAGDLSVVTDGLLTLTPNAGLAGTTGAIANNKLTLEGAGGLIINGVASAVDIDLLSDNGIGINDTVTATGLLKIDSDVDGNAVGDLLIENTSGGILNVSAANMNIHSASTFLLATSGAVHVSSNGELNLVAENDLTISGGDATGADAYFSSRALTNINVGGNILLSGGTAPNTAASIFDETGANTNNMILTAGGSVTLAAGSGDNSGAFISAADLDMSVVGDLTLTGGIGNSSPAIIRGSTGIMRVHTDANLVLTDGAGLQSPARIISIQGSDFNQGLGFLDVSYLSCTGCDTGLVFLDQPIENTANNEIVSTQSTLGSEPIVSSSDALFDQLQQSIEEDGANSSLLNPDGTLADGTQLEGEQAVGDGADDPLASGDSESDEEKQTEAENEPKPKVMVCR